MLEKKENHIEVLFTASVIVCILRYLAILLPDLPFFAVWRSLEQPPQRYCLDFAIIIIFLVCSCVVLSRKTEKGRMLYWSEGISFAALVPAWRYMIDFFSWLETGDLSEINSMIRNAGEAIKIFLMVFLVFLLMGFFIILLRYNDKIKKILHKCIAFIKKDIFLAQFICIMIVIHIIRIGVLFLLWKYSSHYPQLFSEINGMDFVLATAFFIALLIILFHSKKREIEETFTPAVWFGMILCLFGMVPIRNHPAKMIGWFAIITACILTIVLLVWGYHYLRSGKIKETRFWKSFDGNGIIQLAVNHAYNLAGNFVNAIFAPFRFLLSYIDMLGAALLDDDSDDSKNYNNDNIIKRKKYRRVKAKGKQDIKRLAKESSLVKVKPRNKRIGGKQI